MKEKRQSNQYDKVFKENIEVVISNIIKNLLGIKAVSMEELPDDIQHTKERKPDLLKKVTDIQGNIFVLQIEFQVANDEEMPYRMLEYKAMLARKYRIPVHQFVIFLGKGKTKNRTSIKDVCLSFEYNLLAINTINYHTFLKSNQPEEIVLAVLGDFLNDDSELVLNRIISRLEETTNGELPLKRYFKQLRILAQLRKLEQKLKTIIMDNIARYIDEQKDVAYLIGFDKGEEKIITNLLKKLNYSIEQVAEIAGVPVEFVKKVKQKLSVEK